MKKILSPTSLSSFGAEASVLDPGVGLPSTAGVGNFRPKALPGHGWRGRYMSNHMQQAHVEAGNAYGLR